MRTHVRRSIYTRWSTGHGRNFKESSGFDPSVRYPPIADILASSTRRLSKTLQ